MLLRLPPTAPAACCALRRRPSLRPPHTAAARARTVRQRATGDSAGGTAPQATSTSVSDPDDAGGGGSSVDGAVDQQSHATAGTGSSMSAATTSCSSSAQEQQRLLKQLLQVRSVDSVDDATLAPPPATPSQTQQQPPQPAPADAGLYDDPAAAEHDVDPLLLDLRGFSSVGDYLQHELDGALAQAKVAGVAVATWAGLAAALSGPIGGPEAYDLLLDELTGGGSSPGNLGLLWALLLASLTAKGAVMSVATGVRAWRARAAEEQHLEELAEQVEESGQRRAYWRLQERLSRLDAAANRTYSAFALCSLLLGLLLISEGGLEEVQMRLDSLDQGAAADMLVLLLLGTELYLAGIRGFVALVSLATAFVNKLQHKRSQEQREGGE